MSKANLKLLNRALAGAQRLTQQQTLQITNSLIHNNTHTVKLLDITLKRIINQKSKILGFSTRAGASTQQASTSSKAKQRLLKLNLNKDPRWEDNPEHKYW